MYGEADQVSYRNVFEEQRRFHPEYHRKHFFHPALVRSIDRGFHSPKATNPSVPIVRGELALFHYHYRGAQKTLEKARLAVQSLGLNPYDYATLKEVLQNKDKKKTKKVGSWRKIRYLLGYHEQGPTYFLKRNPESKYYDLMYQAFHKLGLFTSS